jgi:hypothetical protein
VDSHRVTRAPHTPPPPPPPRGAVTQRQGYVRRQDSRAQRANDPRGRDKWVSGVALVRRSTRAVRHSARPVSPPVGVLHATRVGGVDGGAALVKAEMGLSSEAIALQQAAKEAGGKDRCEAAGRAGGRRLGRPAGLAECHACRS